MALCIQPIVRSFAALAVTASCGLPLASHAQPRPDGPLDAVTGVRNRRRLVAARSIAPEYAAQQLADHAGLGLRDCEEGRNDTRSARPDRVCAMIRSLSD